jgi:type IV pilus assembly protein PilC
MPLYEYIAKSLGGERTKGAKSAANESELARLLKQEGYFLVSAKSKTETLTKKRFSFGLKKVSLAEKLMATRNLGVMISAGVSLHRALEVLMLQTKNKYFKKTLEDIKEQILKGESLSAALSAHPGVFPEVYCSMVKVGEKTGRIEEVLKVLADQMERSYQLRSKIRGAMIYPIVIIGAMVLIGAIMLIKVVPQLSKTFDELGVELPAMTRFVIFFGDFLAHQWYLVLLILVAIIFAFVWGLKTRFGKRKAHSLLLKIPFISNVVKKINSAYTALTMGALISGGVSIIESLDISSGVVSNVYFKKALKNSAAEIKKGGVLSNSLARYPQLFSGLFVQMVKVGEETGETSEMLSKLADFYEEQVNNITKNLSSVIEPLLLLLIGGAVGFFAVSMIQPIYSIMGTM